MQGQDVLFEASDIPPELLKFFEPADCGECYVCRMVEVFREVRRVLRNDGTLWLNMGDCYNAYNGNAKQGGPVSLTQSAQRQHLPTGYGLTAKRLKPKDLVGMPWRLAFALQADGWYLRADIIWAKPNPMPESVTDRPTRAHEYLFLLSKRASYYYDAEAIREDPAPQSLKRIQQSTFAQQKGGPKDYANGTNPNRSMRATLEHWADNPAGRNKRTVWTVATQAYSEAHFATFPVKLIEPCVLAGTSPQCCETCGAPWARVTERGANPSKWANVGTDMTGGAAKTSNPQTSRGLHRNGGGVYALRTEQGWRPSCRCPAEHNTGSARAVVLDPFMGAGTTALVALRHSRHYLGIELNAEYIKLAEDRLAAGVQRVLWSA